MSVTFTMRPLVFVREHAHGPCFSFPLADSQLVARGDDEEDALAQQQSFLSKLLSTCPASKLADFVYPTQAQLLDVAVVLPRRDLTRRLRIETPVTVPCLVVPDGRAHWVHVIALGHTVYVRPTEDLSRRVTEEVARAAGARSLTAEEYLQVLPTPSHRIVEIEVEVEREDAADAGKRAATQRRNKEAHKLEQARKLLESIGTNLLAKIDRRAPVLERDREVKTLGSLLGGPERLSVMLVGQALAGKSAVAHGLFGQQIMRFSARPVFATSGAQLVAGQSGFGQLQQRVDDVMAAVELLDAVLYFDDYADLFAGNSGSIEDLASMMRPWIADGRVRVVGELTPQTLEHHEKRHVAFFAAMHRITVDALAPAATRKILDAAIGHQERYEPYRSQLRRACVEPLVELAERYLSYQAFPGKAVVLADELRAVHEGEIADDGKPRAVEVSDVYRAFSVRSGIPVFLLRHDQAMRYTEILEFFARRVIGQSEAIESVAQALCTVKAGLQPPHKPLANLLFVGPTGVGKTEVAKTLARFLYGGTDKLVRFDMSEYADAFASERLIRGSERDEGELTRKVRQQPFCVVLLDEIEKAHPAVFDLLLQVLGEGRLSDARGKTTSFVNCIVIMTSNLGASHGQTRSGFGSGASNGSAHDHYREQVDRHFRPEFVNRLDRVIPFSSLAAHEIAQVAQVALRGLCRRDGIDGRGLDLRVSDRALAELATAGFSDVYGARALRRHLEDALVAPVARVVAEAAADADGGALRVVLREHETPDAAGVVDGRGKLGESEGSALAVSLFRGPPRSERRGTQGLRRIATLRRTALQCWSLEIVTEMRDRVEYLVAELARGSRRRAGAPGEAVAEHARLSEALTTLRNAIEALEGAEDLASAALSEGEACEPYVEEAELAMAQFERAFVQSVLGTLRLDEALLLVAAHSDAARLVQWLTELLAAAELRGWTVLVHRWEDKSPAPPWPASLPWGPPRDAAWVAASVDNADAAEIARAWRGVIVRVTGPRAGALMCYEAGLHRFVDAPGAVHTEHLDIRLPKLKFDIADEKLAAHSYALPKRREPGVAIRETAVRVHDYGRDSVASPKAGQVFNVQPSTYWRDQERIVFSILVDRLAGGHDPLPGGDAWS